MFVTGQETVIASYQADGICTAILPGWPEDKLQVVAREDGRNEITLTLTRAHASESWRWIHLRGGTISAICYLSQAAKGQGKVRRTNYDATVSVPPARLGQIQVLTHRPDPGE
jgi:hypothetical protein